MAAEDRVIDDGAGAAVAPMETVPAPADARATTPHLVHIFPSFAPGGVPLRIVNLINLFGSAYRHTIVPLDNAAGAIDSLVPDRDAVVAAAPPKTRNLVASVATIRRALMHLRPDILLTYNWGATEWALTNTLFGFAPHIHFESGFGPEEAERQLTRRVLFRRLALRGATRLVVPSRTLVDIATRAWKLPPDKVCYVPNGVDVERFSAGPKPGGLPGFHRRPEEIVLGTVAPLRPEKNLARLIRGFAAVSGPPASRLLIIGEGRERAGLQRLVDRLGLQERILFTGHVDRVEAAFAELDVFAMSSDTEQMPNSLIQAMAAGLPVAATDVGDIRLILSEANRPFVVPKQDEAALSAALRTLMDDPPLRQRLGHCNRERVRMAYSMEAMLSAYDRLYRVALARRRRAVTQ